MGAFLGVDARSRRGRRAALDPGADVAPRSIRANWWSNRNSARRVAVVTCQDVGLALEQHAIRAEISADLVGGRLGGGDEAFVVIRQGRVT